MELIHWGQRLLTAMTEVLDGERGVFSRETPSHPRFELRSDIDSLLTIFKNSPKIYQKTNQRPTKTSHEERSLAIFRKLASFFTAGFYLEHAAGPGTSEWLVTDVFLLGRHFKPGDASGSNKQPLPFAIPPIRVGQVVRGRGPAVIDGFRLADVQRLAETRAYLVRMSKGSAFLLLDDRPELWRQLMIENAHGVLMRLMDER